MRHLESMFLHLKEVVNANIPFIYVMYIHFHLGTTWELHLSFAA